MKHKKIITVLILSIVGLLILLGYVSFKYSEKTLRTAFANEQIDVFIKSRDFALRSPPGEAVQELRYIRDYYPPGTKQVEGGSLNTIVERVRSEMIASVITDLRNKTGKDLGVDPEKWIQAYGTAAQTERAQQKNAGPGGPN